MTTMKVGDVLTREQVADLLAAESDDDPVHTYLNPNSAMLIGADSHTRADVLTMADNGWVKRAGPSAQAIRHGLVITEPGSSERFAETKEDEHEHD